MKEEIERALREIIDPELAVDIVQLGLVRDIYFGEEIIPGQYEYITVLMTLTSPLCPFADVLIADVCDTVTLLGYGEGKVELTFDPPWEASEEIRLLFGL
jgi:metal-sulfur cluster biosynthetic enzyme